MTTGPRFRLAVYGDGVRASGYVSAARSVPAVEVTAVHGPKGEDGPTPVISGDDAVQTATVEDALAGSFDAAIVAASEPDEVIAGLMQGRASVLVDPSSVADAAHARRIRHLVDEHGGTLWPALPRRFTAEARTARSLLDAGDLGEAVLVRFVEVGDDADGAAVDRAGASSPSTEFDLAAHAADLVDVAATCIERPLRSLIAHTWSAPRSASVVLVSYLAVTAVFDGDTTAVCEVGTCRPTSGSAAGAEYHEALLLGTGGMAMLPWDADAALLFAGGARRAWADSDAAARRLIEAWIGDLRGDDPVETLAGDLVATVAIREAIRHSVRGGGVTTVPGDDEEREA